MNQQELVKELRAKTQAGMNDCFSALKESNNNLEKACEILLTKGKTKKLESVVETKEGIVQAYFSKHYHDAYIVEINCQTDFAARSVEFKNLCWNILLNFVDDKQNENQKLIDGCEKVIKEKIVLKRNNQLSLKPGEKGLSWYYNHANAKLSSIVKLKFESSNEENVTHLADQLCMQIAASNPKYVFRNQVPQNEIDKMKILFETQLRDDPKPKPEKSWPKIIDGKLNKWFSEICLLEQESVFNNKEKVKDILKDYPDVVIDGFVRYELGGE
jgi:elongation factor Ts